MSAAMALTIGTHIVTLINPNPHLPRCRGATCHRRRRCCRCRRSVSLVRVHSCAAHGGVGVRKSGVRVQGGSWHNVLSWLRCRTISAGIRSDDGVRHSSRSRVPCCAAERKMPLLTSLLVYETGVRHAEYICCFVEREHAAWALVDGARTLKRPQPGERGGGGTSPASTG